MDIVLNVVKIVMLCDSDVMFLVWCDSLLCLDVIERLIILDKI